MTLSDAYETYVNGPRRYIAVVGATWIIIVAQLHFTLTILTTTVGAAVREHRNG